MDTCPCIVILVNISTKHFVIDWCAVFVTRALKNTCCHLTFEHAMDLDQSMEATDRNTKALQGTETAAVNQLTTPHLRNVTSSAYTASQLCYQIENTLELSIHYCQVRAHIPARVQITFCLCSDIFKQLTIKDAVYWSVKVWTPLVPHGLRFQRSDMKLGYRVNLTALPEKGYYRTMTCYLSLYDRPLLLGFWIIQSSQIFHMKVWSDSWTHLAVFLCVHCS